MDSHPPPKQGPPSMNDVARAAGVSRMTVSRVLHREGYVKAETARRVEAAIERTGYKRNPMVEDLTNGGALQSETIAFGGNTTSNFADADFGMSVGSLGSGDLFDGILDEVRVS